MNPQSPPCIRPLPWHSVHLSPAICPIFPFLFICWILFKIADCYSPWLDLLYRMSSCQSRTPTAAWRAVQSTAHSWLKTTPNYETCCSPCGITIELTSSAPTQGDPGRMPSCCWTGESPVKHWFAKIPLLVRMSCWRKKKKRGGRNEGSGKYAVGSLRP